MELKPINNEKKRRKQSNHQVIIMGDKELIVTTELKTFHFDLPTDAGINLKHEIYSFNTKWFRFSVRHSKLY